MIQMFPKLITCVAVALLATHCGSPAANPVIPGDFPDPSVIRVGTGYWAAATSSDWAPHFPLLYSSDLKKWELKGAVFQDAPEWAEKNFWAPELQEYKGRYYVYYTARKKDGPLAVAVATADKPEGPYTDHGVLVAQEAGSIDAQAITDENGKRYLVWKEDGNSRKLPTVIWAQELSEDGLKLAGDAPQELIRNDAPWEGAVVEGTFILKHGEYFVMFYSGNACCGRECNYAVGVARSKKLLGPWEKNPANPILKANESWKCPGHGSVVEDVYARHFMLYHAYDTEYGVYTGRHGLLDQILWGAEGWPTINQGSGPSITTPKAADPRMPRDYFYADFSKDLDAGWQWPIGRKPIITQDKQGGGKITIKPSVPTGEDALGTVLARRIVTGEFEASTIVDVRNLEGELAGLCAYARPENALGISAGNNQVILWQRKKDEHQELATMDVPSSGSIWLRMNCREGHLYKFWASADGQNWKGFEQELDGVYLPPWDRAVRVALFVGTMPNRSATFYWLRIGENTDSKTGE